MITERARLFTFDGDVPPALNFGSSDRLFLLVIAPLDRYQNAANLFKSAAFVDDAQDRI
jgi:hypothetical protein